MAIDYTPTTPLPSLIKTGTSGSDDIVGTNANEYLDGLGGDDIIHGQNGDDVIILGPGNDKNYGGSGQDTALFPGDIADYDGLDFSGSLVHVVTSRASAPVDTNSDRLRAIEVFEFRDAIMNAETGAVTLKTPQSGNPVDEPVDEPLNEPVSPNVDTALTLGALDSTAYGNRFAGTEDANGIIETSFTSTGTDLRLSVTGYDIDYVAEVEVRLNGDLLGSLSVGPNNGLNGGDSFDISAVSQLVGTNQLEFVQTGRPTYVWGVTDLLLNEVVLTPPVTEPPVTMPPATSDLILTVGALESRSLGNGYEGLNDADGIIRVVFDQADEALALTIRGFDIDYATEVEVFLNGLALGYLSVGPNNTLNGGDRFLIQADDQQTGLNELHFVQTGKPSYVWGITNLLLAPVDTEVTADFTLTVGETIAQNLGNRFDGQLDADGEISFALERTVYDSQFSLVGYDIDYATEVSVTLNNELLGYLSVGPNNGFNGGDLFTLDHSAMRDGTNVITVKQTGSPSYVWGITDIQLLDATPVVEPEITLLGLDNIEITDGDLSPSLVDGTDMGSVSIHGGMVEQQFTLHNAGSANLILLGYTINGTDSTAFGITTANTVIEPSETSILTVRYSPSQAGLIDAEITLFTNDNDEADYSFTISGRGLDDSASTTANLTTDLGTSAETLPVISLRGTADADQLDGSSARELLDGFGGDDIIHGQGGDDVIVIGAGHDKNYGGSGVDVAIFDGAIADFSGVDGASEIYLIDDLNLDDGDLGFDRVRAVELFAFDDAIFDTRSGETEFMADMSALAARLDDLVTSGEVIA